MGEIREWGESGCTAVVSLRREDEPAFSGIELQCKNHGLKFLHNPLSGKNVVAADRSERAEYDQTSMNRIPEVAALLAAGENVVIHCAAGMHRTGVVCYLVQRHAGVGAEETVENIRITRQVTYNELFKSTAKKPVTLAELAEAEFVAKVPHKIV